MGIFRRKNALKRRACLVPAAMACQPGLSSSTASANSSSGSQKSGVILEAGT